ncbi:MAG: pentapeptide repeat-containing protein, partial [Actinomycetes bacterium]
MRCRATNPARSHLLTTKWPTEINSGCPAADTAAVQIPWPRESAAPEEERLTSTDPARIGGVRTKKTTRITITSTLARPPVVIPPVVAPAPPDCANPGPGKNLSHCDFHNRDLNEFDLHGANLAGVLLRRANLAGADLTGADLIGADLDSANLTDVNLLGVISGGITGTPASLPA